VADKKVLVMGGGAAGIKAALSEAAVGNKVYLAEHFPSVGGERIPQDRIIADGDAFTVPDVAAIKKNENIEFLSNADVQSLVGENGQYKAKIHCRTARVDMEKCDDCGECIKVCPIHMYDDYNEGIEWRTAVDFFNSGSGNYNIFKEDMPVCQRTCPINLDIRTYVGYIADGKHAESLATIRKKLPFPLSVGRICPHPCEEECNRQYKDESISICFLKRFAGDYEINNNIEPRIHVPEEKYSEKIAILGAGPSGLTCAYHLALFGYENITVYEALPEPGGMFRVGIPEYRLPAHILAKDIEFITKHGVEIKCGVRIGQDISFDEIKANHDAVLIAIGAHKGTSIRLKNEDAEGVFDGIKLLKDANLGDEFPITKGKAIVIGGGNVAMDVTRTALRVGFDEVNLLYRRTRKELPASPWEVDAAEEEGVKFNFLTAPQEVVVKDGKAVGVQCLKMELGEPDASGRRKPMPVEGSEFVMDADAIFGAIGQVTDNSLVDEKYGFTFGRKLNFEVNPETFETNVEGVYASGDAATGANIAVRACAGGMKAAESIHKYLRGK
jgi:NADPH-dependent glutamate synthase beta subunit-like oxidoreductase/NAD-dependent dihydropyrimidine dehydrogenase PreA subunit